MQSAKTQGMGRRGFIAAAGALTLGSAMYLGCGEKQQTPYLSLNSIKSQGLPDEFAKFGFSIKEFVNRGTGRDVIIIAENHDHPCLKTMEARLVDYFIKHAGVDSMGLEGLFGAPRNNILEEALQAQSEVIHRYKPKMNLKDPFAGTALMKYVKQESIPCYGLEKKEVHILSNLYNTLIDNAIRLWDARKKGEKYEDYETSPFERQYEDLKNSEIGSKMPKKTFEELTRPDNTEELRALKRLDDIIMVYSRNEAFCASTVKYMQELDSKRSIVFVGNQHTVPQGKEHKPYQDMIPYSYLQIKTPGVFVVQPK